MQKFQTSPRGVIKLRGKDRDYWLLLVYSAVFFFVTVAFKLTPNDQLQMTNTFATISGVLLGLYALVQKPLQWAMVESLLFSILFSLFSSIATVGTPWVTLGILPSNPTIDQILNTVLFGFSGLLFAFTTFMFGMNVTLRNSSE